MDFNYNSQLPNLLLREYGRNIQKIAEYIKDVEDPEQKKRMSISLLEMMRQVNPALKDNQEYAIKAWNDLNIITGFDLNVSHPNFDTPEKHDIHAKPQHVDYPSGRIRYRHYGKNVEHLIEKAILIEDPEEKEKATIYVARVMKRFFESWNKENVDDEVIIEQLSRLSQGKLSLDIEKVKSERLFFISNSGNNNNNTRSNFRKRTNSGGSNNRGNNGKRSNSSNQRRRN